MKKLSLLITSALCCAVFLIFACRRDIDNFVNDQEVPSGFLESAKMYYGANAAPVIKYYGKSYKLTLFWKDAWTVQSGGKSILVVPTLESETVKNREIRRVILFTGDGHTVSEGRVFEFVGFNYEVTSHLKELITNRKSNSIPGFNGAILEYDLNYYALASSVFEKGQKGEKHGAMVTSSSIANNVRFFGGVSSGRGKLSSVHDSAPLKSMTVGKTTMEIPCNGCPPTLNPNCDHQFFYLKVVFTDGHVEESFNYERELNCTGGSTGQSGSGSMALASSSGSGSSYTNGGIPPYGMSSASATLKLTEIQGAAAIRFFANINLAKFIECFTDGKTAANYKITLYVDQPNPGTTDAIAFNAPHPFVISNNPYNVPTGIGFVTQGGKTFDVGHTFVGYTKNNTDGSSVTQVIGFYPADNEGPAGASYVNDGGHTYDVSLTKTVTAAQFNSSLSALTTDLSNSVNYNLAIYNCTNSAVNSMNAGGAALPSSTITGGPISMTPGNTGQVIRAMTGATTTTATAPFSKGPCN
jgi:hypothetical protein